MLGLQLTLSPPPPDESTPSWLSGIGRSSGWTIGNRNGTGSTPCQRSKNRLRFFRHLSSTGAGLGLLGELFVFPVSWPLFILLLPTLSYLYGIGHHSPGRMSHGNTFHRPNTEYSTAGSSERVKTCRLVCLLDMLLAGQPSPQVFRDHKLIWHAAM
jgi:hypothetical protein